MNAKYEFLLQLGDNALILGHRLSEWCGHAPVLEEDIALANTALDLIGHARLWLGLAGEVEGTGRSADDLAFHREARDFRNVLLVEQPNTDFAHTIMRQFLFDAFHLAMLEQLALRKHGGSPERPGPSRDPRIQEIAAKALKEVQYHQERSADLVIRLGDGSEESHQRMQAALDHLWRYVWEMTTWSEAEGAMADDKTDGARQYVFPDPGGIMPAWTARVDPALKAATLRMPDGYPRITGGKTGRMHSEHLGHLLAVMQVLPRSYPDARW